MDVYLTGNYDFQVRLTLCVSNNYPFEAEAQTTLFKDPVRTAL